MKRLVLENLTIGYHAALIENINVEVPTGQFITLLGTNGSGKSTFIKTLLKIVQPLEGYIIYNGKNGDLYSAQEWAQIFSAVFSGMPFIPLISVRELIKIGSRKPNKTLVDQVIQSLEIEHLLDKYANEISDGQLQKVMIARALIQDTPYVIFDEPTAHLDFRNKREVFLLLKNLVASTQKTFIVITHEMLQALALADKVWYIDNKNLYQGTPMEIDKKFKLKEEILKVNDYVSS